MSALGFVRVVPILFAIAQRSRRFYHNARCNLLALFAENALGDDDYLDMFEKPSPAKKAR